jgi:hypothetical protein
MITAAGGSNGLIERGESRDPFYGASSVVACKFIKNQSMRWWIPGVNDSGGGFVGYFPGDANFKGLKITNGGHGEGLLAYLAYMRESWFAALREGQRLAAACQADSCCSCKQIKVILDVGNDIGANGRTTEDSWRTAKGSQVGASDRTNDPNALLPNPEKVFPNCDPISNGLGIPLMPANGSTVIFKVR